MMTRFLVVAALLAPVAVVGCLADTSFSNTHFACTDGVCPSGYQCLQGFCEATAGGGDDAGTSADAAGNPPDAGGAADAAIDYAGLCTQQFGNASGFVLCNAGPATGAEGTMGTVACDFYAVTGDGAGTGGTCADLCARLGGTCIDSYNADAGTECTRGDEGLCNTALNDQDCICAMP